MKRTKISGALLLAGSFLGLIACGATPPEGSASSRLVGGKVRGCTESLCTVSIGSPLAEGEGVLASSQTDAEGAFRLELKSLPQDGLIESNGGEVGTLRLLVPGLRPTEAACPSVVTTLRAALASYLMAQRQTVPDAAAQSSALIDKHFWGARVPHGTIAPLFLKDVEDEEISAEILEAVLHAGFVEQAARLSRTSGQSVVVADLLKQYVEDISDGLFDGRGRGGAQLSFGSYALSGQSLRTEFAEDIRRFLDGSKNPSKIRSSDIAPLLRALAESSLPIFPEAVVSSDITPPTIDIFEVRARTGTISEGARLKGEVTVEVVVSDDFGVVTASISGVPGFDRDSDPAKINLLLNSRELADGDYTLTASAIDKAGHKTTQSKTFWVDETAPVVSVSAPAEVTTNTATLSISVMDSGEIHRTLIDIDGQRAQDIPGDASGELVVEVSCPGRTIVSVRAEDRAGHVSAPVRRGIQCSTSTLQLGFVDTPYYQAEHIDLSISNLGQQVRYEAPVSAPILYLGRRVAYPVEFRKYLSRLDWEGTEAHAAAQNLPRWTLVASSAVPLTAFEYRYLRDGQEVFGFMPLAQEEGRATLAVSYQSLGAAFYTYSQTTLHTLQVRVRDARGGVKTAEVSFYFKPYTSPIYVYDCGLAAPGISRRSVASDYTSGADIYAAQAKAIWTRQGGTGSLAPAGQVRLNLLGGVASTTISAAIEELFRGDFGLAERDPSNPGNVRACGALLAPQSPFAYRPQNGACTDGYHSVLTPITQPRFNDRAVHQIRATSHISGRQSVLAYEGDRAEVRRFIVQPQLTIGGQPYGFETIPNVPMGLRSASASSGQYRLGGFGRQGFEYLYAREETDLLGQRVVWAQKRAYQTDAYIQQIDIGLSALELSGTYSENPEAVVPVVYSGRCQTGHSISLTW